MRTLLSRYRRAAASIAPARASAVRQKLTDLGVKDNPMMNFGNQMRSAMFQGTSDSLKLPPKQRRHKQSCLIRRRKRSTNTDRAPDCQRSPGRVRAQLDHPGG
jgi:hypothetical protein